MSVLKEKRTTSKAEYVNTANQIYVKTVDFLSRLSARYSRLIAADTARLAGQVMDRAEQANKIFPSDMQRKELRKAHHLEALAALSALDVRLTHCYEILYCNPQGAFTDSKEKTVEQVAEWLKGPIAYYEQFNDHGRVLKLRRLYYALFIKDRKTEEEIACIGL